MKYVISNTGSMFQFNVGRMVYSFDTVDSTPISEADYDFIVSRIGGNALKEVDAPIEPAEPVAPAAPIAPAEPVAPAAPTAPVGEQTDNSI